MIKVIKNALILDIATKRAINKDIVIKDNYIDKIIDNYNGDYDLIIDAENNLVMPGLINSHTHLGMSIFRNTNNDLKLMDWLKKLIWPLEDKLTEDDIYYTTLLSCVEMIKGGTTTCADHYFNVRGGLKALLKSKIRCLYTRCLMDSDSKGNSRLNEFLELYNGNNDISSLITFSVSPHSLYTCTKDYLSECSKIAQAYKLPIHIHYLETEEEYKNIKKLNKDTPLNILKSTNLINNKLILAHGVYINDKDINILKKKNVSIVNNPISNLSLGCGICDIKKYIKNNINVCIGTDGVGSCYNLDLFRHMNFSYLIQKGLHKDPTIITPYDIINMATINGAKALDIKDLGSIKEGNKADIIIIDIKKQEKLPINDIATHIVTNITGNDVLTTIIDGEILMLNRMLMLDIDEEELNNKIEEIRMRIGLE